MMRTSRSWVPVVGFLAGVAGLAAILSGPSPVHSSSDATIATPTATFALPDLLVSAVSNPPATALPGGQFKVGDTTANIGGGIAGQSTTGYFLSTDRKPGAGDVAVGRRGVPSLDPGMASTGSTQAVIPTTLSQGAYFVLACADASQRVVELNERNNCHPSSNQIQVGSLPSPPPTATLTRTPTATASPTVTPTVTSTALPTFGHVYVIVMENEEASSIVGNPAAPYINSLISQYALATNYDAVAHPSEPNYLALFSGSTQGVTDDGIYNFSGPNLADQIESAGRSWNVFAENVPLGCYAGATASGGEDGSGTYARKHEPAISFLDISTNATRCAKITDFTHFDPAAANFELIVPNLCNDMHDCSISTGDSFLQAFVPQILTNAAWQQPSVLFLVWDEGSTDIGGGGNVALVVVSNQLVSSGFQSSVLHNHYSLLRTIEDGWGLGCLNNTCSANDLGEFFQ